MELGIECGIPLSTVYRRLQILHDNKVVQTSGNITHDGKKYFLYKSKIEGISVVFNGIQLDVKVRILE